MAAAMSLLLAGTATIATQMAVPSARSEETFTVSLSPDQPVDVRRISVGVTHAGHEPTGVSLSVGSTTFEEFVTDYRLDLVPTDRAEARPDMFEAAYLDGQYFGGPIVEIGLGEVCRRDCDRTYLLITRLADPAGPAVSAELSATIAASYSGEGSEPPPGAEAGLHVAGPGPTPLATLRATAAGHTVVGVDARSTTWQGLLSLSAAGVIDQARTRSIGSLWLTVRAAPSDEDARAGLAISVDDSWLAANQLFDPETPRGQQSFEWLSLCMVDRPCTLPITLEFSWDPWTDNQGTEPRTGSVAIDWTLEATVEYVGLDAPPADAQLELTPE